MSVQKTSNLIVLATTLLLSFTASINVWAAEGDTYQAQFEQAAKASQAGNMEKTISILTSMLKTYPQDLAVSNNLAVAYIKKQQYKKAQQVLESALDGDPRIASLRENLNQIYAYQAQLAYQTVFDKTEITLPKGQWILSASSDLKTPEKSQLKQVERHMQTVADLVERWRAAWASQNISAYLGFYVSIYAPEGYKTHQAWANSRKGSLKRPSYIKIQLDKVQVVPLTPNTIQVTFWQAYESNTFKDKVRKKLVWQKQDQTWKIVQEDVIYE
ncbi:MAG: hypothetical protein DSZ27_06925 [Thiomicrospira sp.]|nr:MAG: hypothetical protein DSZ27_06925 [Thiomicrospira sp.]